MTGYRLWMSVVCGVLLASVSIKPALADLIDVETVEKAEAEAKVSLGYRGTSVHGEPGRAHEFDNLKSSPTFNGRLFTDRGPYRLDLDFGYLNEDDYSAEAHLDTQGLLRVSLRNQRFFHNLDHLPYANGFSGDPAGLPAGRAAGAAAEGSRPDATANGAYRAYYSDHNPGDDYGLQLDMSEAKLKIKYPDYPAHFNLSYWRYEKQGEKQMRFVGENCTTACHMQSRTRKIDRVTEEVKASVDAHVGLIDLVLEGLLRTFRDREPVPQDYFGAHFDPGLRDAGYYEHDEDPDSKLKEVTLRLNTAPSGGFVASAAFTVGKRENRSDLNSVAPIQAETDYYKASADATYTPGQNWTFNLRYRLLDLDSDNSPQLYDYAPTTAFTPSPLPVRSSLDITRAWYEAVANYRPSPHLTLKAEFRREDIDRDQGPADDWELPEEEVITRVKLGFSSRMLEKSVLKLSGWLALQQNDDPAYGTSFGQGQELFLTTSFIPSPQWGLQANVNLLKQDNDEHEYAGVSLDREKEAQNISVGTWINPREGLSFDLNYGYFRTAIDQDMLFGTAVMLLPPTFTTSQDYRIEDSSTDYRQTVQTITVGMTWQAQENLTCRLEGYHSRSRAEFLPEFATQSFPYDIYGASYPGTASSDDLEQVSELDIRQNGVRGRIDWQLDDHLSCGFEATFDDYDEKDSDVFDGSVQSYMASLSYLF